MGLKNVRKTLSPYATIRKPVFNGYPPMLVGYMRVSSDSDRQSTDLQRDALLAAGVDARHLFEDHASGTKDDRTGLARALAITGEKLDAIIAALEGGMSKAAVCRNFGVKRTTVIETLTRVGWTESRATSSR